MSGAFSSRSAPPRTEFLPDLRPQSWHGWLYVLSRQRILSIPLIRWMIGAGIFAGLVWGLARWPGGWWMTLAWFAAAALLAALTAYGRRTQYLHFQLQHLAPPPASALPPSTKTPLYVTGMLGVNSRERLFTHLPGFYRTFATREHALLCQLRTQPVVNVGALPDDEPGLWYAFFRPEQITRIATGTVTAERQELAALAITYTATDKRQRSLTIYLAFPNPSDRLTVLADLIADQSVWQAMKVA